MVTVPDVPSHSPSQQAKMQPVYPRLCFFLRWKARFGLGGVTPGLEVAMPGLALLGPSDFSRSPLTLNPDTVLFLSSHFKLYFFLLRNIFG